MKRTLTRGFSLTLALFMMLSALPLPLNIFAADKVTSTREDISVITPSSTPMNYFKEDTYYTLPSSIDTPLTYEFEISVPKDIGGAGVMGGVILGNYGLDGKRCVSLEIHEYGKVRFYSNTSSGNIDIKFSNKTIEVRKDEILHVAVAIDVATTTARLYVNGELADTQTNAKLNNLPKAKDFPFKFMIGGDSRNGNTRHFEGTINSVALFSDTRTEEEIKEDAKRSKTWGPDTDNLVAAYDLTKQGETALKDYSGNGLTLTYTSGSGVLLKNYGTYTFENKLQAAPETVEAWLFVPDYYKSDRSVGTIFSNYDNNKSGAASFTFEIDAGGHPRIYYSTATGMAYHEFGTVDVRTGSWQHVAIVHDAANKEARCYVNGVLKETLNYTEAKDNENGGKQTPVEAYHSGIINEPYALGGNMKKGNPDFFKGFLKEVRVYSDVRTASEIAADFGGDENVADGGLTAFYKLDQSCLYNDIEDLSGNGYTARFDQLMFDTVEPITDYAYSFAVVGDTQTVTNHNSAKLKDLYRWIVDNKEARNIQYVIGLGDITERGDRGGASYVDETTARNQWAAAKEAITLMDGKVPYSLIRGAGHDGLDFFNEYFGSHTGYTDNITGYFTEGSVENVYHTFKVGAVDYMILCLEFGAKDNVLAWADSVVAAHPHHRVIVTTHGYMERDGSFLEGSETFAPSRYDPESNDGDDIWNKFVRKHANIFMVMSGHMSANDVIVSENIGDNGNVVKQILVNPQSMETSSSLKGMVAMLYFSADGRNVQVEYYSTFTNTWRPKTTFNVTYGGQYETPYGVIPEEYADVDKYPLVVFNSETGSVVYGGTSWRDGAINYCLNNSGKHVIYLRKNISSNVSNYTIGSLNGELTIDLGGNTVSVKNTFLEFQGRDSHSTTVKIMNGTIQMSDTTGKFIGVGGKYGGGTRKNNVTVENISFKNLNGGLVFESFGDAVVTTSDITFKDCSFEVASSCAKELVVLGNHGTNTRVNVRFIGGAFDFGGAECGIFTTGGVSMKNVYFAPSESGEYSKVTVPRSVQLSSVYTTESGITLAINKVSESENSITYQLDTCLHTEGSKCEKCGRKADGITAIYGNSLNLKDDVNVLFYLEIEMDKAKGAYAEIGRESDYEGGTTVLIPISELKTKDIDGRTYYIVSYGVPAKDMGVTIKARLVKDGQIISNEYTYSAQRYIDTVLESEIGGDITKELKDLVSALDVYGKNASAVLNGTAVEAVDEVDFSSVNAASGSKTGNAITLKKFSLELKSNIKLRVYFSTAADSFTVKVGDTETEAVCVVDNVWCIEYAVPAARLYDNFTFTVTAGDSVLTLSVSPLYYAKVINSSTASTDAEKSLMRAIKLYADAAIEYKNSI